MTSKVDNALELAHNMSGCELRSLFLGLVEYLNKIDQDYLVQKLSESENLEDILTELFNCFTPVEGSGVFTNELMDLIDRAKQASEIECESEGLYVTYIGD